jgi:hypothetical protein
MPIFIPPCSMGHAPDRGKKFRDKDTTNSSETIEVMPLPNLPVGPIPAPILKPSRPVGQKINKRPGYVERPESGRLKKKR